MAEQTLNIPQIIAVVLVGFLAVRWFLSSSGQTGNGGASGRQINPTHVEQIHQMFPQLDRRAIMWDLQRNGGSVQATTERVLAGRALDQPPPSFQPQIPASAAPPTSSTSRAGASQAVLPDLITKYNLSAKVASQAKGKQPAEDQGSASTASKQSGWSQSKTERAELLKKRRDDMILKARQKMEQKERDSAAS